MAGLLKKFSIKPRLLNLGGDDRARGYFRQHFVDAWRRYGTNINADLIQAASQDPDPDQTAERVVQDDVFTAAVVTGNDSENASVPNPLRRSPAVYAGRNGVTGKKGDVPTRQHKKVEL